MITHRAIVNRLLWMQTNYRLRSDDRVLQKTVISFDASVWELFVPLLAGAQIILARPGGHKDSKYLVEAVRQQQVTTLQLVPSMLAVLVEEPELDQCLSLRQMWCGGEALSAELARRFHQRSRAVLHNLYGPTETSIDATHCEVERESGGQALVPLGRPIGNMQCHILDRHLQPVPPGVAGELFIGGVGLARGYWKRADLTAEKFIPNPFGEASTRLYRTGDLARYLPGGNIEFLGRADQQVKVRGYRIELGEIEALLTQHREVRAAVVVAREASDGEKRLVAYIVPEQGNASPASNGMPSYVLPNQLEIFHLNKNETDLLYKEIFQDQVYLLHGITLNDGDTVFDVGANISFFSLFVHQRCRDARVYAFEPLPPIFKVLQANINHYGLSTKLFQCGLGKESGMASFTFYPKSSAMSGLYADAAEDERVIRAYMSRQDESLTEYADELMAGRLKSERYDCQVRTLSEIIAEQKIAQIDLLKIDVEKSELDVLEGIKESDWKKIKQIVIEVHDIQGRLTQISELLKSHGYRLTVEQDSAFDVTTGLYNIYAIHGSKQEAQGKPSGQTLRPLRSLAGLSVQEVNEYLRDKLPEYMMPSEIVVLGELPLTANGKVDRRALPEALPSDMGGNEQVAARTPLEEILVGIWKDVLRVDRVGVHDNFFDLGGHSLLATRLISRVRHQLSVEVPLDTLFEAPTISGFAARVEQLLGFDGGSGSLPELVVGARPERLPLSYAQERLWFIDQLHPQSAAYNLPLAVRLRGALNLEALQRSLQRVIERHESLRTTFVMEDGESYQVIADQLLLELPVFDLSGLDAAERERHVAQLLAAEASEGFDLSRGPLLRAQVIKLAEEEHIVSLTMHHIISDGWSLGVLIRELSAFYNAAVDKRGSSELSTLPPQYADYALSQREWLTGGALAAQLNYWRDQLAGAPVLELPSDKPRPVMQSMRGGHEVFRVSAELTEQLWALALREGATLFMVLLAVFEVLLARYSGQRDVVVGMPIANRNRYETEEIIGFFVNMLALRIKLREGESFREVVREVRNVTLAAYANQDVPFEKLVEELQPQRDTSRQPIFQVMFVMQNAPQEALRLKGLEVSGAGGGAAVSQYDLSLAVNESGDGLVCMIEYCTELFEAETIRRMSEHWQRLCEEVARDSEQSIWEMKMLGAQERKQLVTEWNETAAAYVQQEKRIHELIEEQALLRPEALAVIAEDGELSYGELNRQANQLAHYLRGLGVGPEVRVGICLERSLEMIVSLLAVLKAGGAYVPLDPAYPRERLSFMLADSSVSLLLTQQALSENLFPHNPKLICVDTDRSRWQHERQSNLDVTIEADHLAYIIFTSGSTGRPKGAMNSHRAITNRLLWMQQAFALTPADAVMQKTPFSFDVSVWEFFWPLMTGARLVMARPGGHQDPAYLVQLIDEQQITVLHFVPSMLELFIEERRVATACRSLREVICSGETLRYAVQERFFERLPQAKLANLYGPTETAVDVTIWQCERETQRQLVPIGRPIANTQIYIVDERMQPVPIGVAGELLIGGMGVGRGYVASPELTADRFIPDPFSSAGGQRLYRSGDLARYGNDGNIEYLGRLDHQIKLRGFRIELGEIENALSRHPQVSKVAVIAHEDKDGNKRLIAYIVANMDHAPEVGDLKNFLRQNLPDYMVPTDFILLDELPLTPNGKLDRRALPVYVSSRSGRKEDFIAPRNELEIGLAEIWKELLGITTVGVKDNFFDIGGHSLLAVRMMARIQQRFDRELPLSTVFQGATIEYLADQLGRQIEPAASSPLVAIQPKGSRTPFFCVHAIGGNVLSFYYLARYLAPEQPLYGLEAPRLHQVEDTFLTIEEYAARYLVAVREIQPVGPYLLGGYSFGGNVAFEMAQQLQAQGQETAMLAVFDTASPSVFNSLPATDDEVDLLVGLAWAEARSRDKYLLLSAEHMRSLESEERLQYFLDEINKADITPLNVEITMLQRFLTGFRARQKALRSYQPREIYKGRITLFRCEEQDPETRKSLEKAGLQTDDPLYGWAKHSSQPVEAHVIAGHHNRMFFDPYVENLARSVTACLERAQRNGAAHRQSAR
jgi:amino acid adenylation domain-containing protein/FkbM family methyltransferase